MIASFSGHLCWSLSYRIWVALDSNFFWFILFKLNATNKNVNICFISFHARMRSTQTLHFVIGQNFFACTWKLNCGAPKKPAVLFLEFRKKEKLRWNIFHEYRRAKSPQTQMSKYGTINRKKDNNKNVVPATRLNFYNIRYSILKSCSLFTVHSSRCYCYCYCYDVVLISALEIIQKIYCLWWRHRTTQIKCLLISIYYLLIEIPVFGIDWVRLLSLNSLDDRKLLLLFVMFELYSRFTRSLDVVASEMFNQFK